ncbi:translation elongation factor EF-1 subunit alpha [archaeon]|nr:translation elongation factor EF-1 subunit alpha [archaeon]
MAKKEHLNLVFIGHVDHGKSTLIGSIFHSTGALTEQQLQKYKDKAKELGKSTWEFAYLTDATEQERKRGVTIELSHKKFETDKYVFTIIDAPGHKDFIKNMITGASQGDAAVLVIDAKDGVMPQTKEHIFLSKTLGIKQLMVAVNKMDLVDYKEDRFKKVKEDLKVWLRNAGYNPDTIDYIPVSAIEQQNIMEKSDKMGWYDGKPFVKTLNELKMPEKPVDLPLRVPIQDVYGITGIGAVPVGKVQTGVLKVGDQVVFMPGGATGEMKSIEMHHESVPEAEPGDNIGFNVRGVGKNDVRRGEVLGPADNPPIVAKRFKAQVIIIDHPTVITAGYTPVFHAGTAQVACTFDKLLAKVDARTGAVKEENPDVLRTGDAAIVEVVPKKPMCIEEKKKIPQLSNFAIRDMGKTIGAGMCIKVLEEAKVEAKKSKKKK